MDLEVYVELSSYAAAHGQHLMSGRACVASPANPSLASWVPRHAENFALSAKRWFSKSSSKLALCHRKSAWSDDSGRAAKASLHWSRFC